MSKSIVSLLYGIALERGEVPKVNTPLLDLFPDYADLGGDPDRRQRTIEHALTMTLGMDWDEARPYTDPENSEIAMEMAPDRYRYILERPLVAEPGTRWIYSGGATALIGEILQRGTGQTLADYASAHLFASLGILRFEWNAGRDGTLSPASGLRLTAPDLLKIGRLILNNGVWNDHRVVPEAWLTASLRPVIATGEGPRLRLFLVLRPGSGAGAGWPGLLVCRLRQWWSAALGLPEGRCRRRQLLRRLQQLDGLDPANPRLDRNHPGESGKGVAVFAPNFVTKPWLDPLMSG